MKYYTISRKPNRIIIEKDWTYGYKFSFGIYEKFRVKQVYNSRFRAVTMLASPVPRMCTKVYLWLLVLGIRLSAS